MVADEVRPEDHLRLAAYVTTRTLRRPTEDDFAEARLALVEAAAEWNAGKRPCPWPTFAGLRIRWALLRRFSRAEIAVTLREVPLFLEGEDEDDEIERPEMAVEDPGLAAAAARADVEPLLAGLDRRSRYVLERRFGIRGEAATLKGIGDELGSGREVARRVEEKALQALRRRARVRLEAGAVADFLRRLEGAPVRRARRTRLPGIRTRSGRYAFP